MRNTIEFYNGGQKVRTVVDVETVITYTDHVRVTYREEKKVKVISTTLPYIYYTEQEK